jgi:hypothetical protein
MAEPKKGAQLCDRVLEALTLESLPGGDDELLDCSYREVLKQPIAWHGVGKKGRSARQVLTDGRGSQPAYLEQMTPIRSEKRREAVAVGLNDQVAAGRKEALKCVLCSAKHGLLASRPEHRGEFVHREHGIGRDRSVGFKDLFQSANMIMCRIVRIAGGHQPFSKAELGYLPIDKFGADGLFQVISQRYERGSTVITTNRAFKQWPEIFNNDSTLTSALLDRLLHHAESVVIDGRSYRMRDQTDA